MFVNLVFVDIAGIDSNFKRLQTATAFKVDFATKGIGSCECRRGVGFMARNHGVAFPAVVQRPAISDDDIVVFPLVAKYIEQKVFVGAARFAL